MNTKPVNHTAKAAAQRPAGAIILRPAFGAKHRARMAAEKPYLDVVDQLKDLGGNQSGSTDLVEQAIEGLAKLRHSMGDEPDFEKYDLDAYLLRIKHRIAVRCFYQLFGSEPCA